MRTFKIMCAQGDVVLIRVESLPKGAEPVRAEGSAYIIAHSETGHNHIVMERPDVKMYRLPEEIYEAFLVVGSDEPALLEHQRSYDTHETIAIPKGTYRIRRQREYVPEGFRRAAD